MERIQSPNNPRIKLARHLREGRQRKKHQRTIVDGLREIRIAIESGIELDSLFIADQPDHQIPDWVLDLPSERVFLVSSELMEKIAFGERASDGVAIIHMPSSDIDHIKLPSNPLILVLDRCEKPGNLGAAIRTADACNASAVVLTQPECEPMNPNAIRASLGAIFTVPIATCTPSQLLDWLKRNRIQPFAARVDGSELYTVPSYSQPSAFILGSEAHGLGPEWNDPDVKAIRLPMLGRMDSLNVSVTGAVLLYEAVRQRGNG